MNYKKIISICLCLAICIVFVFIGYYNNDKITKYFEDNFREAQKVGSIKVEDILAVTGENKLLVATKSGVKAFDNNLSQNMSNDYNISKILTDSHGEYTVMATNESNDIFLYRNSELMWSKSISYEIVDVSVNSNGFISIVYYQSGYKTGLKVYDYLGNEQFTYSLASTYALDTIISLDNKKLFIAEANINGIILKSDIRVIDMTKVSEVTQFDTIEMENNELIIKMEYSKNNQLLVQTDKRIYLIENTTKNTICEFDKKNTLLASIENVAFPIVVEKSTSEGKYGSLVLKIYNSEKDFIEIELNNSPQDIATSKDKVILSFGDRVEVYSTGGKKQVEYSFISQLKDMKVFYRGSLLALIFSDKIEVIKI